MYFVDTNKLKFNIMINELVKELTEQYGTKRDALLPILQGIIKEEKYLSETTLVKVAEALDISSADVFGTASFYSFLEPKPQGDYVIRVCQTIVCDMQGKEEIIRTLEKCLSIKVGETTSDKKFSLFTTNCLGWCANGPAMLINDDIFIDLTPKKIREIIKTYKVK